MLAIQKYLQTHSLEELTNEFAIKVTRHPLYPNLCHFKYDQIASDFSHQEVKESRALILDENDDWYVIAHPYNKFKNFGEPGADTIDWNSARVFDKIDGSLIVLYQYGEHWQVATTGTPDGGQFADLFWKQWEKQGCELPEGYDEGSTWMFEYVSLETRVVVPYPEPHIYFHGYRDCNGKESSIELFRDIYNWDLVKSYQLSSIEDVCKLAATFTPDKQEGLVVVDKDFHRLKVKNELYVLVHHLKSSMSERSLLDVARKNEDSELLVYFPDIRDKVENYKQQLETLDFLISDTFLKFYVLSRNPGELPDRRKFAAFATSKDSFHYSGCLFAMLDKKVQTPREWFAKIQIDNLLDLLKRIENERS
jgi:hypothetical protein